MAQIALHEIGMRDGLQIEKRVGPTSQKLAWLAQLIASRVDIIQVGSFVHPDKVPQMTRCFECWRRHRRPRAPRCEGSC